MPPFRFPLERVLEHRAVQLAAEKLKLQELRKDLAGMVEELEQVRVERASARRLVEEPGHGTGSDLKALAAYLLRCKKKEREILGRQQELGRRIGHQLDCVLKARQNHHLLEKLRQRRLEQWTYESNRETERVASEAYLARWVRQ